MNNDNPLVSVLMTCYNREKYVAEAIESVLSSTYKNFELIIVDDASEDNTVAIARSYEKKDDRVRVYVNEKNLSDYVNRNKAASYAKGKYLKYLDSDDIIYKFGLGVYVEAMETFPDAAFGLSSYYDPKTLYPACIPTREIYLEHFYGFTHFFRAPGSAIIRRDIFELVGGFSGIRYIGDTELWLKLATKYPMVKLNDGVYWSRVHPNQDKELNNYPMLIRGEKIINEYLNSPNCPLTIEDLKGIRKKLFMRKIKSKLVNILSKI